MEPSVEYIVAVLSVLRCGEAFMPLDPTWPKSRILSLLSSSKADLVIGIESPIEGNCCHKLDTLQWLIDDVTCPVLPVSVKENIKEQSHPLLMAWPCESESPRSFCYLMYTSGSSGNPKGVCGTEIGLLNRFLWMQEAYPLHDGDVVLFKTAISFIDHMQEFLGAVLTTCTLVIPPFNQLKENIFYVVDFLQGYFINRLVAVPSLMRAIIPSLQSPSSVVIQDSLKLLVLSGEVLHLSLCKMLLKLLPQTLILNLYGSTEVFSDALMAEKVSNDDDFFMMGGNSISAAYVSFKLGIHMKLLYTFPTPLSLQMALSSTSSAIGTDGHLRMDLRWPEEMLLSRESRIPNFQGSKPHRRFFRADSNRDISNHPKKLKTESYTYEGPLQEQSPTDTLWTPSAMHTECSFTRCNKSMHGGLCTEKYSCDTVWSNIIQRDGKGFMRELWKVEMDSCVDASPLLVFKGSALYVFIGSHSRKFVCVDGKSGVVQWETKLEGRVECSAAILDDFSQLDVTRESFISFTFQMAASAGVSKLMVRCGSYDQNLYAIDYKSYCCVYKLPCGGSIFGSPVINEILPFKKLWEQDMGAPIFGSLSISYPDGNIICCLVDGTVLVLNTCGSIVWKVRTDGPIFAGPCTSQALPSQGTGNLIWKHAIGHPITSSAYVDENTQVLSNGSILSDRLICVCDSSGGIHVLTVDSNAIGGSKQNMRDIVQEFARLDLEGDIFSSPVMIGGRVFVGCRDDHVYCIKLEVDAYT
ncbi:putative acyl-activating enzyme 19 [Sesamum angolense]|uniref:Acyl-activating enzyme 19 n=1 Tax=Sesamum angolense TaxID=2727404 RepID=A0AAE1WP56_9LAMI|nr:putative acyl-activating enzyme 19 [Sesamum angolense]